MADTAIRPSSTYARMGFRPRDSAARKLADALGVTSIADWSDAEGARRAKIDPSRFESIELPILEFSGI